MIGVIPSCKSNCKIDCQYNRRTIRMLACKKVSVKNRLEMRKTGRVLGLFVSRTEVVRCVKSTM